MPRGHEHIPTYSLSINARLPKVFQEEDSKGKKDRCAVFGCNNDRLYPREIYSDKPYF